MSSKKDPSRLERLTEGMENTPLTKEVVDFLRFHWGMTYVEIRDLSIRKGWVGDAADFESKMQEFDKEQL